MRYARLPACVLVLLCCAGGLAAYHLRDDFSRREDHWLWIQDGRGSRLGAGQGLCTLELTDPSEKIYCNAELVNRDDHYLLYGTLTIRCKGTAMLPGSRGWGWWDRNKLEVFSDFDVAWVMQSRDRTPDPRTNWLSWGHSAGVVQDKAAWDLADVVDPEEWHTYRMEWGPSSVSLYINDTLVRTSSRAVPDNEMSMDIWIDNQPVGFFGPTFRYEGWQGTSRLLIDYVEIYDTPPAQSYPVSGTVRLWERPNAVASGAVKSLWKRYSFHSPEGEAMVVVTAKAEAYGGTINDDDIKLRLDQHDFGWNTPYAVDGEKTRGGATSVVIPTRLSAGAHTLEIHADNTPLLYDIVVVASGADGGVVWDSLLQVRGKGGAGYPAAEASISAARRGEHVVVVSASVRKGEQVFVSIDGEPRRRPGQVLDEASHIGEVKTLVIRRQLTRGEHRITLYASGRPIIHRLTVFAAGGTAGPLARPDGTPSSSRMVLVEADGARRTVRVPSAPAGGSCGMYTVNGRAVFVRNNIASGTTVHLPAVAPGLTVRRLRFGRRESRVVRIHY